jgi:hypothetical protein
MPTLPLQVVETAKFCLSPKFYSQFPSEAASQIRIAPDTSPLVLLLYQIHLVYLFYSLHLPLNFLCTSKGVVKLDSVSQQNDSGSDLIIEMSTPTFIRIKFHPEHFPLFFQI